MPDLIVDRPPGAPGTAAPALPVLLTHGAGGNAAGAGLAALAGGLAAAGHLVARFNLPYREQGRATPPPAERSVPGYAEAAAQARATLDPRPWALGGKSYGGRVASLAVAGGLEAAALVFYGYPLHPPGKPEAVRVAHWPSIAVPCLFLEGTQDPFCDLGLLRANLDTLGGPATLHVVEGGDHSLRVRSARRGEGAVLADLAVVVAEWLDALPATSER